MMLLLPEFCFDITRFKPAGVLTLQQLKSTTDQELVKAMGCLNDMENMCRRCATELDVHIGKIFALSLSK